MKHQLLALTIACTAFGSCKSTDTALEELVWDTAGDSAVIIRPASTSSVVGLEIVNGQAANRILRTTESELTKAESWASRELTYTDKSKFGLDFSYYVDVSAVSESEFKGKAKVNGLVVEHVSDPIAAVQSASLGTLIQADGTFKFEVYKSQLRADSVTFDGSLTEELGLKLKPAVDVTSKISEAFTVGIDASNKVELSGKGKGTKLVLGAIPANVEVTRITHNRKEAGKKAEVGGFRVSLNEESASNYKAKISSIGMEINVEGEFNDFVSLLQGSGRSLVLVVDRNALGSYNYTVQEFTATWVE